MSIFSAVGGLLGGLFSSNAAKKNAEAERAFQREVAQNQIQWKIEDGKKAGVHPLAAMGHQLTMPAATSVGTPDYSSMGQNIGRALDATTSSNEKADDYTKTVQALNIDRMNLENDVIRTQLVNSAAATTRQPSSPPTYNSGSTEGPGDKLRRDSLPMGVIDMKQSRRWAPAQDVEDEYGDVAQNIYGIGKFIRDLNASTKLDGDDPRTVRYWKKKYKEYQERPKNFRRSGRADHGYW